MIEWLFHIKAKRRAKRICSDGWTAIGHNWQTFYMQAVNDLLRKHMTSEN